MHALRGYRVEIPEELVVRAGFADGTPARLIFSAIHNGPPTQTLAMEGSTGNLTIDFLTEEICLVQNGEINRLETPPPLSRPWRVEQDFVQAVRDPSKPRPRPTFADGVAYMKVVEAVDEARRSGTRVSVSTD